MAGSAQAVESMIITQDEDNVERLMIGIGLGMQDAGRDTQTGKEGSDQVCENRLDQS
jgi:hypothetical protein